MKSACIVQLASASISAALVASTGGITLLPLYARNLLSPSVIIRPLQGEAPTIDLVMGYNKANTSPLLKRFLSRADELRARVSQRGTPTNSHSQH
jgi:LysR family transcriptional regulator, hca operon transcriptional activator